jgi:hypothetical protein
MQDNCGAQNKMTERFDNTPANRLEGSELFHAMSSRKCGGTILTPFLHMELCRYQYSRNPMSMLDYGGTS